MHKKFLLTNILLALALSLAATGARADSETGAANITIGSTAVFSGTPGLLYGASSLVQSLPGTVAIGSNYESLAFGNNVQLSLTTDGTSANFAATLALINTSTTGGWGNALEVYGNVGGTYSLNTYINNSGIFYSTLNMVISGHYSSGSGSGGHYGPGFSVLSPNNYYPNMYGCWADITGSCYQARNNAGTPGELSFSGQTHTGVFTIGLDAENSQFILGNTTITTSGQVFTGDTSISRIGAGQLAIGNASAGGTDFSGSIKLSGINDQGFIIGKARTVSAATDTISAMSDYFLCVAYTSTGAVTETLPAGVAGQTFLIKDCGGAAATHSITIIPSSGTIDGGSSYSLATNYGSVALTYVNSQWSTN